MTDAGLAAADAFILKWQGVIASGLSTSQSFLIDLCALLGVDMPHATAEQDYMFEPARGPWKRRLPQLLDRLVALGRAQETDGEFRPAG